MTVPNYPNGVTHDMAEAGTEAFTRAGYKGVALGATETGEHPVLNSPTAIGIALSRAFPAMADRMEGGARDALLHPGPIGGDDLAGWRGMQPKHRAQHVHQHAPAYLLGVAAALHGQRHALAAPSQNAALGFLADAVTALARQMERANAVLRRVEEYERQCRAERDAALAEEQDRRMNAAREAGRRAAKRPKKRAKARKAGAS